MSSSRVKGQFSPGLSGPAGPRIPSLQFRLAERSDGCLLEGAIAPDAIDRSSRAVGADAAGPILLQQHRTGATLPWRKPGRRTLRLSLVNAAR